MADATDATPKKRGYEPADWEATFLVTLRTTANVRGSCIAADIQRSTAYRRKAAYKRFAALWDEAVEEATDILEASAWKRATEGTTRERPIFYKDDQVATEVITEYSDTLLIFLLKAHRPDKFRETSRSVSINLTADDLAGMTDDDLDELERKLTRTR